MTSETFVCGRCGGSIGRPPDGMRDHVCRDQRPPAPTEDPAPAEPYDDPILRHARQAGYDGAEEEGA